MQAWIEKRQQRRLAEGYMLQPDRLRALLCLSLMHSAKCRQLQQATASWCPHPSPFALKHPRGPALLACQPVSTGATNPLAT